MVVIQAVTARLKLVTPVHGTLRKPPERQNSYHLKDDIHLAWRCV